MQLYVYDASGKLTLIEGQLKEYFVYAQKKKLSATTRIMYCICMIMMRIKKKMNYLTVSEACMQKVRRQITFYGKGRYGKYFKEAHALIFSDDGEWYYYNFQNKRQSI